MINYDVILDDNWNNFTPTFTVDKKLKWIPLHPETGERLTKSEYRDLLLSELNDGKGPILSYQHSIVQNYNIPTKFKFWTKNISEEHILKLEYDGKSLKIMEEFIREGKRYGSKSDVKILSLEESEDFIINKYGSKYNIK